MKYFLMLAAAASLAACHNRSEDEVGAAPDQGDTTAVIADTTTAAPTDTSYVGQDTTATPTPGDSALVDDQVPDTTTGALPTDTTSAVPSDTSTGAYTDTTSTMGQDTSSMEMPADSASQPSQ